MGVTTRKTSRKRTSRRAKKADQSVEKATKEGLAVIDENLAAIDGKEPKAEATSKRSKKPGAKKKAAAKTRSSKPKGKLSALAAAAKVLAEKGEPMRCQEIVDVMLQKKLWSTQGKTPAATLYSAMIREIQRKGKDTRFEKVDRGRFQSRK